jgi:hypothetical protein
LKSKIPFDIYDATKPTFIDRAEIRLFRVISGVVITHLYGAKDSLVSDIIAPFGPNRYQLFYAYSFRGDLFTGAMLV